MKFIHLCNCDQTSRSKCGHYNTCQLFECKECKLPCVKGRTLCEKHLPILKCKYCDNHCVAFMSLCDEHVELDRQMLLARFKRHSDHQKFKLALKRYIWDRETRLKKKEKEACWLAEHMKLEKSKKELEDKLKEAQQKRACDQRIARNGQKRHNGAKPPGKTFLECKAARIAGGAYMFI